VNVLLDEKHSKLSLDLPTEEEVDDDKIIVPKNWIIDLAAGEETPLTQETEEIIVKVGQRIYFMVVCYDITSPKRLAKVAKTCQSFGERVQKSIFECHLTTRQLNRMIASLVPLIDEDEDVLRIYKIAGTPQVMVWGKIPLTEDEDLVII
jgi:CRISPR-associated protein Cas2